MKRTRSTLVVSLMAGALVLPGVPSASAVGLPPLPALSLPTGLPVPLPVPLPISVPIIGQPAPTPGPTPTAGGQPTATATPTATPSATASTAPSAGSAAPQRPTGSAGKPTVARSAPRFQPRSALGSGTRAVIGSSSVLVVPAARPSAAKPETLAPVGTIPSAATALAPSTAASLTNVSLPSNHDLPVFLVVLAALLVASAGSANIAVRRNARTVGPALLA